MGDEVYKRDWLGRDIDHNALALLMLTLSYRLAYFIIYFVSCYLLPIRMLKRYLARTYKTF